MGNYWSYNQPHSTATTTDNQLSKNDAESASESTPAPELTSAPEPTLAPEPTPKSTTAPPDTPKSSPKPSSRRRRWSEAGQIKKRHRRVRHTLR